MGLFNTILEKLGIKKPAVAAPAPAQPVAPKPPVGDSRTPPVRMTPSTMPKPAAFQPAAPVVPAIPVVDVVSKLEKMAAANPEKLDWKVSIVDMLKLLGMDSSLTARKQLAAELGCPANLIGGDYSQMNIWLHKTVLQKIADNGGNIPTSLLK